MKKIQKSNYKIFRWIRYSLLAMILLTSVPGWGSGLGPAFGSEMAYSETPQSLDDINDALEDETNNIIQTGRLISNIIVVISFVMLMLNIAFKVMDNSKATVIFLFILFLRGLYEVIF